MVCLEISCFNCCCRILFVLLANQRVRVVMQKKSSKISRQIWHVCVKALLWHPLSARVESQCLSWWTKRRCCRKKNFHKNVEVIASIFYLCSPNRKERHQLFCIRTSFRKRADDGRELGNKKKLLKNLAVKNKVFTFKKNFHKNLEVIG